MKIHLLCWARNEADVLEAHVRHHTRFAHAFTYVLHRCRDNSADILTRLAAEGLPVTFRTDERLLHAQNDVMTQLMKEALAEGADWILPVDADEFVQGDVSRALAQATGTLPLRMPWRGYVPLGSDPQAEPCVLRRITHRRSTEKPVWYKVIIPKSVATEKAETAITFGNHSVRQNGMILTPEETSLTIAHFPVRSERQLRRKMYGSWLSHLADPERPAGGSFQWEAAYRDLKNQGVIASETLTKLAVEYAGIQQWVSLPESSKVNAYIDPPCIDPKPQSVIHDPVPCDFDLRYGILEADPVSVLMETAEAVATDHALLARRVREA